MCGVEEAVLGKGKKEEEEEGSEGEKNENNICTLQALH